jgi:uncharacterized protein YjiS (DUF1127 family)
MAAFAQGTHSAPLSRPRTGLSGLIAGLLAWHAERREINRTMRNLSQMDLRDLQDLGITPYDFDAIAHGVFKR